MSMRGRVTAAVLGTAVALSAAPVSAQESNSGECPAVVALVARGSEQNEVFTPTRYSEDTLWQSNGYEERTLSALFTGLEQYWLDETGESLLEDVLVLGLEPGSYPAAFPLGEKFGSFLDLNDSLNSGRQGVVQTADDFEAATGCSPDYLLVGYSQGSLVMAGQEAEFLDRGNYVGTVLVANPGQRPGDPTVIGHQAELGGLTSALTRPEDTVRTISYCIDGDIVCDLHPNQFLRAVQVPEVIEMSRDDMKVMQPHSHYFIVPRDSDTVLYEQIAHWIIEARAA